jgi:hypothetical protein
MTIEDFIRFSQVSAGTNGTYAVLWLQYVTILQQRDLLRDKMGAKNITGLIFSWKDHILR